MASTRETYTPDAELVKLLAGTGETLFQFVCRHADLVKARESELGAYPGDGPTSEQMDSLLTTLRPLIETPDSLELLTLYYAFRAAVQAEMSWLFPERDPIGVAMTAALREVQNMTGKVLEQAQPETAPKLHRYASLASVENAARRWEVLHGNSLYWRLRSNVLISLARFLYWLCGGKRL